jgi:hypothetical protein
MGIFARRLGAGLQDLLVGEGKVDRQRACAQQHGHAVGASRVKLPEIWPEPPAIGSRITGAEITLPSRTIGLPRSAAGPPCPL